MADPSITGVLIDDSQDLTWLAGIALADFQDAYYIDTALALPPLGIFTPAPSNEWIRGRAWRPVTGSPHIEVGGVAWHGVDGSPAIKITSRQGAWRMIR